MITQTEKSAVAFPGTEDEIPAPLEFNQCQEAVQRLTEYLSSELQPAEEKAVQRHLSECKGCFAKFQFEETLLRTIRERVERVHAPDNLREKILGLFSPKLQ